MRKDFTKTKEVFPLPNLISIQINSYNWLIKEGLKELFDEVTPIKDAKDNLELHFLDYFLEESKFDDETARKRNMTFEVPLKVKVRLINKRTKEVKDQEVFFGDFPKMTSKGTFVINGIERLVVSQLVRSPGVFFVSESGPFGELFGVKIIPTRGDWFEIDTNSKGVISVRINRGRKIPITTLLRALGFSTDQQIFDLFKDVNTNPDRNYIKLTLEKDPAKSVDEGLVEVYRRIRPGELATPDNARQLIQSRFFNFRQYDLGKVGRYKINKRLGLKFPNDFKHRLLQKEDLVAIIKELIQLNNGIGEADDIDHLGNRRVRTVGELVQKSFRIGILRIERIIKDRMSVSDLETVTPAQLINVRPIIAAIQEFFASSQLSQFMDQTNPLSELGHKRRLSAMGPGGLSRERASFEVRDVHRSHYGRICPIETPEGPNIGLVNSLACYAKINEYGFIETPYRKVLNNVKNSPKYTTGHIVWKSILDPKTGKEILKSGQEITSQIAKILAKLSIDEIPIKTKVINEIVYLDANEEEKMIIAQANARLDSKGYFLDDKVSVRRFGRPDMESIGRIDYMDVSSRQITSITTAMIPFLGHDDGSRAQMGSNMMRQAVPLIRSEAPLVGTGIERRVALDSGQVVICRRDGKVEESNTLQIVISAKGKKDIYSLSKFVRSNQGTCINQRPIVSEGQKVKKGSILTDSFSTDNGEIALGINIFVAFMPWGGGNFEDAILISEKLVKEDLYSSIHIERFSIEVRDTKLGPEVVTRDIPNVGEESLKDLDSEGIICVGAEVNPNDILVGKITPKGETELTAEERLLRAIFGEKARDVKDTSLRLPHGERGKIVDIKIFSKDKGDNLPVGVSKLIEVSIAQLRKITVGDKMAGRHGNKGVISRILPEEDMPYLEDGTPVDIILNPLGVTSRMNIGQILETHLGWAAKTLGYKVSVPTLGVFKEDIVKKELEKSNLPSSGKVQLYDGRTGDPFDEKTVVGYIYMMKLHHLVEDKVHARSIGPYSLVTQQPLGGKAQFGGQRFGEMEVWALEAYGAANILQEMLTIKSDDVVGRSKTYEAIIKGERIRKPHTPESFNVLVKELQSLGLKVDLVSKSEGIRKEAEKTEEETKKISERLGIKK